MKCLMVTTSRAVVVIDWRSKAHANCPHVTEDVTVDFVGAASLSPNLSIVPVKCHVMTMVVGCLGCVRWGQR